MAAVCSARAADNTRRREDPALRIEDFKRVHRRTVGAPTARDHHVTVRERCRRRAAPRDGQRAPPGTMPFASGSYISADAVAVCDVTGRLSISVVASVVPPTRRPGRPVISPRHVPRGASIGRPSATSRRSRTPLRSRRALRRASADHEHAAIVERDADRARCGCTSAGPASHWPVGTSGTSPCTSMAERCDGEESGKRGSKQPQLHSASSEMACGEQEPALRTRP